MKGRKDFSPREIRLIDGFIASICRALHLPDEDNELRQCGWSAFLSVYRDCPAAFSRATLPGWQRAFSIIWQALEQVWKSMGLWRFGQSSLDQSINWEDPMPRLELLQSPHGNFQDSVCFHDYVRSMTHDMRCMAYGLMDGSSIAEIETYYQWDHAHTYSIYNDLRTQMQKYLEI